jgi:ribonuclease-3
MLRWIRSYFSKRSLDSLSRGKLALIESVIGTTIKNPQIYLRALRHRSSLIESNLSTHESYEQLEFLGDAVLDLIVTEILFEKFPKHDEGFMTKLRSKLVKEETLANLSIKLNFPELVEVGERVKGQGIELKKSVLCDIFEAILGALYIDAGIDAARNFVKRVYDDHIDITAISNKHDNYKSLLLEFAQAKRMSVPEYKVVNESGPDHDKTFEIEAIVNNKTLGYGRGKNKKMAEQEAAMEALNCLRSSRNE